MSVDPSSFRARLFIDSVQRELNDGLSLGPDQILLLLYLAGRYSEFRCLALRNYFTVSRFTVLAARSDALMRYRRGMIPVNWEEDYNAELERFAPWGGMGY